MKLGCGLALVRAEPDATQRTVARRQQQVVDRAVDHGPAQGDLGPSSACASPPGAVRQSVRQAAARLSSRSVHRCIRARLRCGDQAAAGIATDRGVTGQTVRLERPAYRRGRSAGRRRGRGPHATPGRPRSTGRRRAAPAGRPRAPAGRRRAPRPGRAATCATATIAATSGPRHRQRRPGRPVASAAAVGKLWVSPTHARAGGSGSPCAATTLAVTVRAPANEICWPMMVRNSVSTWSTLPGVRRPGRAATSGASNGSARSRPSRPPGRRPGRAGGPAGPARPAWSTLESASRSSTSYPPSAPE